ncbi:DUF3429 domain-containing protein [Qipengyuania sp. DGS5-3]|uniref:DUF3429 domain-containing protein n=1 Tax=Qipengyuania sp. DGS5-3 TaxID=3349632 RepID=UPI0036D2A111
MRDVPSTPRLLGLAGTLPQLACVALLFLGEPEWRDITRMGALIYAALIFTFLGGTWWGIAASAPAAERRHALGWLWLASILPSLLAFAAVLWPLHGMAIEPALVSLGGGLIFALLVDAKLAALAPPWWMQLRVPLSLILGFATLLIAWY